MPCCGIIQLLRIPSEKKHIQAEQHVYFVYTKFESGKKDA